jgi:hypothetical protein
MLGVSAQSTLAVAQLRAAVAERMVPRISFVGSNATTKPVIESSFKHALGLLEAHLVSRPYVMGGRPSMADFGLWGQLYEAATDPTPGAILRSSAPKVMDWIVRVLFPMVEGEFETWATLAPTLMPLLTDEVGGMFLPWSTANAAAIAKDEREFSTTLREGAAWTQAPQKYHARSLAEIRRKYAAAKSAELDAILEKASCLRWLAQA